jgi:hypothetical protein
MPRRERGETGLCRGMKQGMVLALTHNQEVKGFQNVIYDRGCSSGSLAFRFCELLHDGWFYPHSFGGGSDSYIGRLFTRPQSGSLILKIKNWPKTGGFHQTNIDY